MKRFLLKSGQHTEDDKIYNAGDVVESCRDLAVLFVNKFNTIVENIEDEETSDEDEEVEQDEEVIEEEAEQDEDEETSDEDEDAPEIMEHDEDLSEEYPSAISNGLRVLRKKQWIHIVSGDDLSRPLNPRGLRRDKVELFIEDLLKEDD